MCCEKASDCAGDLCIVLFGGNSGQLFSFELNENRNVREVP